MKYQYKTEHVQERSEALMAPSLSQLLDKLIQDNAAAGWEVVAMCYGSPGGGTFYDFYKIVSKKAVDKGPRPVWAGPCGEIGMDGKPVPVTETWDAFRERLAKWESDE